MPASYPDKIRQVENGIFVADEEKILAGIRRTLAGHADEWSVSYFSDPLAALDISRKAPEDIVMSDMMMPVCMRSRHGGSTRRQLSGT